MQPVAKFSLQPDPTQAANGATTIILLLVTKVANAFHRRQPSLNTWMRLVPKNGVAEFMPADFQAQSRFSNLYGQ